MPRSSRRLRPPNQPASGTSTSTAFATTPGQATRPVYASAGLYPTPREVEAIAFPDVAPILEDYLLAPPSHLVFPPSPLVRASPTGTTRPYHPTSLPSKQSETNNYAVLTDSAGRQLVRRRNGTETSVTKKPVGPPGSLSFPRDKKEAELLVREDIAVRVQPTNPLSYPPADPSDRKSYMRSLLEVFPGEYLPLFGTEETVDYLHRNEVRSTDCPVCEKNIHVLDVAAYMLCPDCLVVSPLPDHRTLQEKGVEIVGVGIGMRTNEFRNWYDDTQRSGRG